MSSIFSTGQDYIGLKSGWSSTARMPASLLVSLPRLCLTPNDTTRPMACSNHLTPLVLFRLVWRRLCKALLSSSSLDGQKHPSLVSRLV